MKQQLSLLLLLMIFSFTVSAEDITATITHMYTYTGGQVIDGDVALNITPSSNECPGGFFLRNSGSDSYKNMVAFLLSAYHAKANVRLIGYPSPWPNPEIWCELETFAFVP